MRTVQLGTSGIQVSEFFVGAGSIGGVGSTASTRGSGLTPEEGMDRLDEAVELGITVVDTADAYGGGESEKAVGRWLHERAPEGMVVTTKVGMISRPDGSRGVDLTRAHIEKQLSQSLERLGRVDAYLMHAQDMETPLEETLAVFSEAQDAGRIGGYGVSNIPVARLQEILSVADANGLRRPITIENPLNLLDRSDEAEGIAYTAFSPLAGGVLSERYLDGAAPAEGSRIAVAGDVYYKGFHTTENLERVAALRDLARELDLSVSGLALAWLRDHPGVTAPIVAPRTTAQWDAVTDADRVRLDPDQHTRVGAIFA
jgi:aryl-alcohol dehydrogenase-like predicted oxidoreductase